VPRTDYLSEKNGGDFSCTENFVQKKTPIKNVMQKIITVFVMITDKTSQGRISPSPKKAPPWGRGNVR
jgi:hypothetical protein